MNENIDLTTILKQALNSRNNPKDFKAIHIGKVIIFLTIYCIFEHSALNLR